MERVLSVTASIEQRIEAQLLTLARADAGISELQPDVRGYWDQSRGKAKLACVARVSELRNDDLSANFGGVYYTAKISLGAFAVVESDAQVIALNKLAYRCGQILSALAGQFTEAAPSSLDCYDVYFDWFEQMESEAIEDGSTVGRIVSIMGHFRAQ